MLTKQKLKGAFQLTGNKHPETGRFLWKFIGNMNDADFSATFGYDPDQALIDPWKLEAMAAGVGLSDLNYAENISDAEILSWLKSNRKRFNRVRELILDEKKIWFNWAKGLKDESLFKSPSVLSKYAKDDDDAWHDPLDDELDDEA